jgi:hypothetical protein
VVGPAEEKETFADYLQPLVVLKEDGWGLQTDYEVKDGRQTLSPHYAVRMNLRMCLKSDLMHSGSVDVVGDELVKMDL